ncbi:MAG: hypothetical protein LH650_12135 [Chloroflexi bacterium]|nr:hypothetical protein [Chloroflexota bacterium]
MSTRLRAPWMSILAVLCLLAMLIWSDAVTAPSGGFDLRGRWDWVTTTCPTDSTCQQARGTMTIRRQDAKGAFSGTWSISGYTWQVQGTVAGGQVELASVLRGSVLHPARRRARCPCRMAGSS